MPSLLNYLWLALRHPKYRDYLHMGIGIEARYRRCEPYWKRHLEFSKNFQCEAIAAVKKRSRIGVLGAGMLYDVPLSELLEVFEHVELFDADPRAVADWSKNSLMRKYRERIKFHHCELSGSISHWTRDLDRQIKQDSRPEAVLECLQTLVVRPVEIGQFSTMFSINLLGQIPIYWRDRIYKHLAACWRIDVDDLPLRYPQINQAIEITMSSLQRQHLELLGASAEECVVVISDQEYYYYRSDRSAWQVEPALYGKLEVLLPGHKQQAKDSWLWHIAPQGIEQNDYGEIHRVGAWRFGA